MSRGARIDHRRKGQRSGSEPYNDPFKALNLGHVALATACLGVGLVLASSISSRQLGLLVLAISGIPILTMTVATFKRFLLTVIVVEIGLRLDVNLGHDVDPSLFETLSILNPDHINALAGFNISLTTLALAVLYVLLFAELAGRRRTPEGVGKTVFPALLYLVLISVSVIIADSRLLAMFEWVLVAQAFLLLLYLVLTVRERVDVVFLLVALATGLLLQASIAVGQALFDLGFTVGPAATFRWGDRVAGTVGSPASMGAYLSVLIGPSVGLALSDLPLRFRVLGATATVMGAVALFFTASRGGWLGTAVACSLLLLLAYKRGWVSRIQLVGMVIAGLVVLSLSLGVLVETVEGGSDFETRVDLMRIATGMALDNAWFGVGLNNFAAAIDPYVTVDFSRQWVSTVHNKYLLVWAETGALSLLAFTWIFGSALTRASAVVRQGDRLLGAAVAGLAAGIVANLVHMGFEIFHSRPQTQMLWVVTGLAWATHRLWVEEGQVDDEPEGAGSQPGIAEDPAAV